MFTLKENIFFNLTEFSHAELFSGTYIWDPLHFLKKYLGTICLGEIEGEVSSSSYLVNQEKITIGKGSIVEPGAYIKGPCYIGKGCVVRHGAYIRGDVIIGDQCVIGHDTEIKHSILLNQVEAAHFAYVGDSIIGNKVLLGAGVKCANVRLDKQGIKVFFQTETFVTGLRKMGSILADGVQIGCNAVLNPGTIMGSNTICYPCTAIQGVVLENKMVK